MKYFCEIFDRCEGQVHYTVEAASEELAHDEASVHAAEVGCRDVSEIVIFEADYLMRDAFEAATYAHYLQRRADGAIAGDSEQAIAHEQLMWRQEDGSYGVLIHNAAWWGWQAALTDSGASATH